MTSFQFVDFSQYNNITINDKKMECQLVIKNIEIIEIINDFNIQNNIIKKNVDYSLIQYEYFKNINNYIKWNYIPIS